MQKSWHMHSTWFSCVNIHALFDHVLIYLLTSDFCCSSTSLSRRALLRASFVETSSSLMVLFLCSSWSITRWLKGRHPINTQQTGHSYIEVYIDLSKKYIKKGYLSVCVNQVIHIQKFTYYLGFSKKILIRGTWVSVLVLIIFIKE